MEQEIKIGTTLSDVGQAYTRRAGTVRDKRGDQQNLDIDKIRSTILWAADIYSADIDVSMIVEEAVKNIFDDISLSGLADALVLASSAFIELDPAYGYISSRLLFKRLFKRVTDYSVKDTHYEVLYRASLADGIHYGVRCGLFDKRLLDFDCFYLSEHLDLSRDNLLGYVGMRTLYERYFARYEEKYFELPQVFWMRVAMGLSYNEPNRHESAIRFYNLISTLQYVPGTPTLLHSGLVRPQLSSCYLSTVEDDLKHIFKSYGDNAQMSKYSGGVANDWSNIRATGAEIKTINIESQGVVPFLKIANDTTAAINRSGKRRSATVVYLEVWHLEIEDFLDLRRNTGDERRRTHDINTASWVPDLFIKRVLEDGQWTLFSPHEVPDLHHIYGHKFEQRYIACEEQAQKGIIKLHKTIPARQLWRKMLSRLFETGHPWITFKDPSNIRSPQDHVGVVHSSNLCTEITLNTSADEIAVCNLGSINLSRHIHNGVLDKESLAQTIHTAIRMLDNVIDINFYPVPEAQNSNLRHRPIGLGLMGLQDALYMLNINFDSPEILTFVSTTMEFIAYHAILASSELAKERGAYSSYKGSKWNRGIFPQDTLELLEKERGLPITTKKNETLDWQIVRAHVAQYGMRNSNVMAIAPTATISNISGCFPCIEPAYKNLYVKANMSGEFTIINKYLVQDLKNINAWNKDTIEMLKYYDGNIQMIDGIPQELKNKYKEAFDLDPIMQVHITAQLGKWIDQSISHNVFLKGTSGKLLHDIYIIGWFAGLKTFYYLRTLGATQIEKATLDAKKFGFTQKRTYETFESVEPMINDHSEDINAIQSKSIINVQAARACSLVDPDCESCQ
ncbi:MAG TPA: ribonucleoside-diphosphate reductase subunit alpha [Candidatus Babeliales bacterium]|jgi:ribonucleoside-diphosphate reductase alpha chain|nr:ribonucleoside-diphosphate reductase subunit alpha [Candidatus Babeliales bacterium]